MASSFPLSLSHSFSLSRSLRIFSVFLALLSEHWALGTLLLLEEEERREGDGGGNSRRDATAQVLCAL